MKCDDKRQNQALLGLRNSNQIIRFWHRFDEFLFISFLKKYSLNFTIEYYQQIFVISNGSHFGIGCILQFNRLWQG